MTDHLNRPIFVTGLPRSGTSLVAGLLHLSGAWVGTTVPASEANPRGFFEHIAIRESVTKAILAKLGYDPLGVSSLPRLDEDLSVRNLAGLLGQMIRRDGYGGDTPWLYKDAKLSLIWPAYAKAFPAAMWIIARREPAQVVQSCLRTPFMRQHSDDPAFWEKFVTSYEERLTRLADTVENCMILDPEDVLHGRYAAISAAASRCGLVFDENQASSFIQQEFWHSAT